MKVYRRGTGIGPSADIKTPRRCRVFGCALPEYFYGLVFIAEAVPTRISSPRSLGGLLTLYACEFVNANKLVFSRAFEDKGIFIILQTLLQHLSYIGKHLILLKYRDHIPGDSV